MVPRTGDHPDRDAALLELLEQQRGAALEQVVLAAHQERRDLDPLDDVDRRAVLVELPVVRRVAAQHRRRQQRTGEGGRGGQPVEQRPDRRRGVVAGVRRRDQAGAGDQPHPERDEADVDLATGRDDVAVDVRARNLREDRLEAGRVRGRGEELADAHVRRAGHPGLAVAPRLAMGPGHDLAEVLGLAGAERLPDALRRAGPARVHGQLGIAALDQVVRARTAEPTAGEDGLVVGRDRDDHRQRLRDHRTVRPRRPDQVGAQHDPVVHRDRKIRGGDRPGILLGPRRPVQLARRRVGAGGVGDRSLVCAGTSRDQGQPGDERQGGEDRDGGTHARLHTAANDGSGLLSRLSATRRRCSRRPAVEVRRLKVPVLGPHGGG